jgi:hypothetical protein
MAALGADEFAVWIGYHRPELVAQHAIRASEYKSWVISWDLRHHCQLKHFAVNRM